MLIERVLQTSLSRKEKIFNLAILILVCVSFSLLIAYYALNSYRALSLAAGSPENGCRTVLNKVFVGYPDTIIFNNVPINYDSCLGDVVFTGNKTTRALVRRGGMSNLAFTFCKTIGESVRFCRQRSVVINSLFDNNNSSSNNFSRPEEGECAIIEENGVRSLQPQRCDFPGGFLPEETRFFESFGPSFFKELVLITCQRMDRWGPYDCRTKNPKIYEAVGFAFSITSLVVLVIKVAVYIYRLSGAKVVQSEIVTNDAGQVTQRRSVLQL